MKTLKTIIAGLALTIFASGMNAGTIKGKDGSIATETRGTSVIKTMIQVPAEFRQQGFNENVKVLFLVDKTGKVSQVLAVCANPELKKSVEYQFQQLNFTQFTEKTLYSVNINFKVF